MKRGPLAYILTASGIGLVVPALFRFSSSALEALPSVPDGVWSTFDLIQLMLWPIPMLLAPTQEPGAPDLSAWGPFAVATLANVALYGGIGGLIWVGVSRSRWFLAVPGVLIAGIWYAAWRV